MDFSKIAGEVAASGAPIIGGLLGSLFGPMGSVLGTKIGSAVGDALGVPATPEAINAAIASDPLGASEKLSTLELAHAEAFKAEAESLARIVEANSQYYRDTLVSTDKFTSRARPMAIYGMTGSAVGLVVTAVPALFLGKAAEFVAVVTALGVPLGALGALATGAAWSRGKEKIAALTGVPGASVVGGVVKSLKGK